MDCSLCIICQQAKPEDLKCPLNSCVAGDKTNAYKSIQPNSTNPVTWNSTTPRWSKQRIREIAAQMSLIRKGWVNARYETYRTCLFCGKGDEVGDLHQVSTFNTGHNIRTMITEQQDTQLLAKIVGGDLIAAEAKYHLKCLVNLRNRFRGLTRKLNQVDANEKMTESVLKKLLILEPSFSNSLRSTLCMSVVFRT